MTNLTELTAVYQWPLPDEKSFTRQAQKGLEKEGPGIVQLLNQTGETPVVAGAGSDGLAIVTDKRTIVVKRGKIRKEVSHANVRETRLMKHPGLGPFVAIHGSGSTHIMLHTMSIANTVAVTIDQICGL